MLTDFFWPRYYKSKNVNSFYFQQDGAPAHKHKEVQQWLTAKLGPKFLDKTMWPPRSPDLNPCDYFLWGYLKDKVYAKIPETSGVARPKNLTVPNFKPFYLIFL